MTYQEPGRENNRPGSTERRRVMTLTQLKYVITIADTGSMNEAAKLLFISQPSLSLALKELEND